MKIFEGVYTALVTPFDHDKIDYQSLEKLIEMQKQNGIAGFVVNGTTAESPTLSEAEQLELLEFVLKRKGNCRVIFGSGSNCTQKTIALSQKAEKAGAEGLLVVVPYYNKPPQHGLYLHFKAVAEAVGIPLMLYNVPGRTITSLTVETVEKLSHIKNICAIKEASGNLAFGRELITALPADFIVSSGDDGSSLALRQLGGRGVVSVCSHIMPKQMVKWFHGDLSTSVHKEFETYRPLIDALYISSNPIPVKAALQIRGIIKNADVRLPLSPLEVEPRSILLEVLERYQEKL